jgi:hypothetical protein
MSSGTRKIKCLGNKVQTNEFYLHPITLSLGQNKNNQPICPSEIYYENGKTRTIAHYDNKKLSDRDVQTFMSLPYLNLNINQVLDIYKIKTVDDIINWVNTSIMENKQYHTINRIINLWIRQNIDDLQLTYKNNNNNVLFTLYKLLNKKFFPQIKIDEKTISDWIKNIELDDFNLDLGKKLFNI